MQYIEIVIKSKCYLFGITREGRKEKKNNKNMIFIILKNNLVFCFHRFFVFCL
jgi:hypothetical protein